MSLENLKKQYDEALKNINDNAKIELAKELKVLFDKYPKINDVSFKNYAPYFADGEPCVFSANYDYLEINGINEYDDDEESEKYCEDGETPSDEFSEVFSQLPDSVYESMFGNNTEVTFHRDGKVEVDDYEDHD